MVSVVIPIYKTTPSNLELISLKQCAKILGTHTITFIKPQSLATTDYEIPDLKFATESFDDHFFENVRGYNKLMLSEEFYRRFLHFKYILIYQLDAFVFKDELIEWCRKGYDYIGAPWLDIFNPGKSFRNRLKFKLTARKEYKENIKQPGTNLPTDIQFYRKVGNGGFSLRNVEKFLRICQNKKEQIEYYNQHSYHHYYNEDVFWSLEVNRQRKALNIPGYKTALRFSFEQQPSFALHSITQGHLPFGCHAWAMFPEFWTPHIRAAGYEI